MTQEYSGIKVTRDINSVDGLLARSKTPFEMRLYKYNRSPIDGMLSYPEDLFLDPAHQCLMRIEVYESQESYLSTKRSGVSKVLMPGISNGIQSAIRSAEKSDLIPSSWADTGSDIAQLLVNALPASLGAVDAQLGGVFQSLFSGNLSARGEGRDSYTEEQTGMVDKNIRRMAAIYLYMPTGLEASYGMDYEDESMASMDNMKLAKAIAQGKSDATKDIGKRMALANTKLLDRLGEAFGVEGSTLSKYIMAKDRQVVNPMTLHLFKDVKRREFSFSYTFLPRNEHELHSIYKIMHTLKYYSHPKRSEGSGRFLDYPAEFQISFVMPNGKLNEYLPIIHKCVLTHIKVKYGEDAVFSTIDVENGGAPPTRIEMELTFSELEILTRERFAHNEANGHATP